jgi:hypothetical protein
LQGRVRIGNGMITNSFETLQAQSKAPEVVEDAPVRVARQGKRKKRKFNNSRKARWHKVEAGKKHAKKVRKTCLKMSRAA